MSSKSLQKAAIIDITASKIRIKHPDITKNPCTVISSPLSAGGTVLTVLDNHGFIDDDWMILGRIGDNRTEEVDVNGAVTRGSSLTITNTTKFAHELQAPVTKIYERQIKLYGSATDGVAGTLIATFSIEWNKYWSEYTLKTTDTAYAYYYAAYYDGTTIGSSSDYVASTGLTGTAVFKVIQDALDMTGAGISTSMPIEMLVRYANDCQTAISQFLYQDPQTQRYVPIDWDHEIDEDTSLSISENQNRYSLSSLSLKYSATRTVISVRIGDGLALEKITPQEMDEELSEKHYTELSAEATAGATTLTVNSNVTFADSGSLYIGSEIITYTGKSSTTGFTGVPASGTGAITATHAVDSPVWQNISPDVPTKYTIFDNYLIFNCPPDGDYEDCTIHFKYYKKPTALSEVSDVTTVPFYNVFQYYIASRIEQRRGNKEESLSLMQEFNKMVLANSQFRDVLLKAPTKTKVYAI
ncbi:MAG: hypothetical protein WC332_02735 [Clostridia bacterium]|jgi:hypothetical protein